jgi:hypothetical protein
MALATLYTVLCPATKVEESFNVQAVHDILVHRTTLDEVRSWRVGRQGRAGRWLEGRLPLVPTQPLLEGWGQ